MAGFFAWIMWLVVHVMYLVGFKNRFTTVIHWAVSFIFRGRSQRTTTRQQIVARTLMARLSAAEEALKDADQQELSPEPSAELRPEPSELRPEPSELRPEPVEGRASKRRAPNSQTGDRTDQPGDTAPVKQAPDS
jgi:NADH dehydrogenase